MDYKEIFLFALSCTADGEVNLGIFRITCDINARMQPKLSGDKIPEPCTDDMLASGAAQVADAVRNSP